MSMNGQFWAFSQQEIDAMEADNALIDKWISEKKYAYVVDLGTIWDVLRWAIQDCYFFLNDELFVSHALSYGCFLISKELVEGEAKHSHSFDEDVLRYLQEGVEDWIKGGEGEGDLYREKLFFNEFKAGNYEELKEKISELEAFYKKAAEKGLGAVFAVM